MGEWAGMGRGGRCRVGAGRVAVVGRSVQIVEDDAVDVSTLLRTALGAPDSIATMARAVRRVRADEDAALAAWSEAIAGYDEALRARDHAIARAEACLRRRMAPLSPARYARMEQSFARALPQHRSAAWVRDMIHVQRTRRAVNQARSGLAALTADNDADLSAARTARSEATTRLVEVFGLRGACQATGLSSRELSRMRTGR